MSHLLFNHYDFEHFFFAKNGMTNLPVMIFRVTQSKLKPENNTV